MGACTADPYSAIAIAPMTVHVHRAILRPDRITKGCNGMRQEARGLTLIELLVTLVVASVVLGIGIPSFQKLQQQTRAATAFHLLTTSLASARMAAIRNRTPVSVCPSDDGHHCRSDTVWDDGWIVFADPARTGQPESIAAVIQRIDGFGGRMALRGTVGRKLVRFTPDGWAYGTNLSIHLCVKKNAKNLGIVVVNNAGRPRTERKAENELCPFSL